MTLLHKQMRLHVTHYKQNKIFFYSKYFASCVWQKGRV